MGTVIALGLFAAGAIVFVGIVYAAGSLLAGVFRFFTSTPKSPRPGE